MYLIYLGQVVSDTFFCEKVTDFALSEWENCHFCFKKNKIKLLNSKHLSLPLWAFTAPNFNTLVYSDILGWTDFWSSILMCSKKKKDCKLLKKGRSRNLKIWKLLMNWWIVKLFWVTIFRFLHLSVPNDELLITLNILQILHVASEWISPHCEWWGILKHAV